MLDNVLHEDDEFREWVRNSCVRSTLYHQPFKQAKKKKKNNWLFDLTGSHESTKQRDSEYVYDLGTTQLTQN